MAAQTYEYFLWGLDLGASPLFVYEDPKRPGDIYATLYRFRRPGKEGERPESFGVLLFCAFSCWGVDPMPLVGNELTHRREALALLKEEVVWFDSQQEVIAALSRGRWGMGLFGRLSAFRAFRDQVADHWSFSRPRRALGVDSTTFALLEYDPFEGGECYALTPALARFVGQLPTAAKANYARISKGSTEGDRGEGRKLFSVESELREDQQQTLDILEANCNDVVEAAVETFSEEELLIPQHSQEVFCCLTEAREAAQPKQRLNLVERPEQDTTTEHYPYKSRGMPEGAAMRPDLRKVK